MLPKISLLNAWHWKFLLFHFILFYFYLYPDFSEKPFHPPRPPKKKKKEKNSIYFIMLYGSFVTLK